MHRLKTFVLGIAAGIMIAIGGTVSLASDVKVIGALFFTVGLFVICTFGYNLFTGKICYVFERDKNYALDLPIILVGNFVGTFAVALINSLTRFGPMLTEKAIALCDPKLSDSLLSLFLLGIGCNILIFVAVDGFARIENAVGKYLSLFFGVMVFILCGFEHCVADMFYFSMAGAWSWDTLLRLLVIVLGNAVGGVLMPLLRMWISRSKKEN